MSVNEISNTCLENYIQRRKVMKSVLIILGVLALSHHAFAASCSGVKQYNTILQPACIGDDIDTLWPNYENFAQYYKCQGTGNPVLVNCALDTFFSYNLQVCTTCSKFIPAPECENLITESKAVCVPLNDSVATVVPSIPQYNTTLQPACIGNDIYILWPNYENFSQFYKCLSAGTPVLVNCAVNTYFSYYLQMCTSSDKFEPAPKCELLATQNKPVCTPTTPVATEKPTAPTGKPTEAPTEKPTNAPTADPTETPATETPESPEDTTADEPSPPTSAPNAPPTPPNVGRPDIPTPPSVSTSAPNIPNPPSPVPTPPAVFPTPPSVI